MIDEAIATVVKVAVEDAVDQALARAGLDPGRRRLLSVEEMGESLGVGRDKAYELVGPGPGKGEIFSVSIGRRRLVPVDALDEYVARLCQQAAG